MDSRTTPLEHRFATALLDPDAPVPSGLTGPAGDPVARRFAVYRNNVTVGLVDALAEIFPTVKNLLGDAFFRAMARLYVMKNPPKSPVIADYGETFADFVAAFAPASHLVYLADVARLERIWLDVYHEADAAPMDQEILIGMTPERLASLRLQPHPALRMASFGHAAVTIVSRDRSGQSLAGVDPMKPERALLTRPGCDVELRHLDAAGETFIGQLCRGETLGAAAAAAIGVERDFPVIEAIKAIVQAGCFTGPRNEEDGHR